MIYTAYPGKLRFRPSADAQPLLPNVMESSTSTSTTFPYRMKSRSRTPRRWSSNLTMLTLLIGPHGPSRPTRSMLSNSSLRSMATVSAMTSWLLRPSCLTSKCKSCPFSEDIYSPARQTGSMGPEVFVSEFSL